MMSKRFDGRDEPIIEPDLPIIDAHHHLFERPGLRYLLDDYLADTRLGHRIVASVYMEILAFARPHGPAHLRPLGEIEFANGVAAMAASGFYGPCRVAAAIVGQADLREGDGVGELLDLAIQRAPERFRGIRMITMDHPSPAPFRHVTNKPPSGSLHHPQFRKGFAHLARRGLSFDAAVFSLQLGDIAELADAFPATPIVLNHGGMAMGLEMPAEERLALLPPLRASLRDLALRPNVTCKIGGFGMPLWGFGLSEDDRAESVGYRELAAAWAPYVEAAIDAFGPARCMMESNFPVDGRTCGFVPLWNALKYIVRAYTPAEKAALFHDTAARVYRVVPIDA
jgi:predicted TIM-barrel fold metal-dependent hydrolase